MSRARDMANLGVQAGSGLDASDITTGTFSTSVIPNLAGDKITSGTLSNTVQDNITRLGTVTSGTFNGTFPAGNVIQGGIIDLPATAVNCDDGSNGDASSGTNVVHDGGGSLLGDTTITPKSNSSKFLFHLSVHGDLNSAGPTPTKLALWSSKSGTHGLVIETYWHSRVASEEPLPHVGTGFFDNTDGNNFTVKLRGYTTTSVELSIGKIRNQSNSNKTSSIVFYEVQT